MSCFTVLGQETCPRQTQCLLMFTFTSHNACSISQPNPTNARIPTSSQPANSHWDSPTDFRIMGLPPSGVPGTSLLMTTLHECAYSFGPPAGGWAKEPRPSYRSVSCLDYMRLPPRSICLLEREKCDFFFTWLHHVLNLAF